MKKLIICTVSLILIILIITGCKVKKVEDVTDAEKISLEYTVSKNNGFIYVTYNKLMSILDSEGIVYIGYPENDYCREIVKIIAKLTANNDLKVYYFNPKQLLQEDKAKTTNLLKKLEQENFNVPAVYFIKNKTIIDKELSLSKRLKDEYLQKTEKKELVELYNTKIENYINLYQKEQR